MSLGSPSTESMAAPEPARPREIRALWVWLAVALVALVANLRQPLDPDIWFQLLAGQYTLDHWAIPRHEFFLYAGATEPQVFGGWGFGLIHELGVRLMGPFSLSMVNSMMWSGVLLLALAAARLRNGRAISATLTWPETAGLMLAMLVVFQGFLPRTQMRAEVTLYLAWMATLVVFEKARQQGAMRQHFVAAPLIAWGLAWLHTGGFLLLGLVGACALQRMFDLGWKAFWRTEGRWHVLCLAATAVLPVLNPNGVFQVYAHLVNLVQGLTGTLPASPLPDRTIVEYLPLWAEPSRRNWPAAGFLAIAMLIMLSTRTQRRLVDWLLILPLVAMSCLHVRSLGLLAMAVCVPLCASVSAWMGRRDGEAGQATIMQDRAAKGLLAFLTFAMLWIGFSALSWGWQSRSSAYPAQGILETIRQRSPEGARIFTDERLSSQIPYRLGLKYQVPFAGHTLIRNVPAEGHFMTVRDTNAGWLAEMQRYDVDYAIVPVMQGGEAYTLSVALVLSQDWDLLGVDGMTVLFAKRKAQGPLEPQAHWLKGMRFYSQMELIARMQGLNEVSEATVRLLKDMREHEAKPETFEWPDVRSMDPAFRAPGQNGGAK